MKVDKIIKNARVFTSDVKNLNASAFAVKDGKFVYVGSEEGLKDFEGEVIDLGGKFVMPAVEDSHVHLTSSVKSDFSKLPPQIICSGKKECLDFLAGYIAENPDLPLYHLMLGMALLNGEKLTKDDLDAVCSEKPVVIQEAECHSAWVNSKVLQNAGVTDETPDIAPGLSYYERDENGHKTGFLIEMTLGRALGELGTSGITDEMIRGSLKKWIDFSTEHGVSAVYEAGTPAGGAFHERVYDVLKDMDEKGELPVFVDGSYAICDPAELDGIMDILKRYREKYNTKHMRFNTLKIVLDGTMKVHTACMLSPYAGTDCLGGRLFNERQLADIIKMLNAEGYDLHVHTVAEGAVRTVLDAVELARKELGDAYRVHVTAAHLELVHKDDIARFAELGVNANYTAWWHYGDCAEGSLETGTAMLGEERAHQLYRCKSVYDTGANVCFSCDTIMFFFGFWNPYLGMEVAARRQITEKTKIEAMAPVTPAAYPQENEKMSIEESVLCYTINNAKQLGIAERKGSIEVGKDADFLVFAQNLLTAEPEGLSNILPEEVYLEGRKF